MAAVDAILVGFVSFLVGALAIFAGARLVIDESTGFGRAVAAAVVGALAWAAVGYFFGWLPVVGPVLALLAWVGVVNAAYPGGWVSAAGVGVTAWVVAVVVLYALASVGVVGFDAVGVPAV